MFDTALQRLELGTVEHGLAFGGIFDFEAPGEFAQHGNDACSSRGKSLRHGKAVVLDRLAERVLTEHRHGGISMLTPEQVHFGQADQIITRREVVLREARAARPERFVSGEPKPKLLPQTVWINPPHPSLTTQEIALSLIPLSVSFLLTGSGRLPGKIT